MFPNFGHVHFHKKVGFRQKLDLWVIKKFKIGAKAQPGKSNETMFNQISYNKSTVDQF